jgi:hypothetical protein
VTWLLALAAAALAGCAVALGAGSAACLDINSKTGLVARSPASAPGKDRDEEPAGLSCRGGASSARH